MKTKLTLTVDDEAVRQVKRLAKRRGTSVSSLFEQWSLQVSKPEAPESLADSLSGLWAGQDAGDLDEVRLRALLEKHVG